MKPETFDDLAAALRFDTTLRQPNALTPRAPLTMDLVERGIAEANLHSWRESRDSIVTYWIDTAEGPALLAGNVLDFTDDASALRWTIRGDTLIFRSWRSIATEHMPADALLLAVNQWNTIHEWPVGAVDFVSSRFCTRARIPLFTGTTPAEISMLVLIAARSVAAFYFAVENEVAPRSWI